jgi:small subunit ribosomal protein S20
MPIKPSAAKRTRQNVKHRERNRAARSHMRTLIKRIERLIEAKDVEGVKQTLPLALKAIGKTAQRGIIHKGNAARKESRLLLKVNKFLNSQAGQP